MNDNVKLIISINSKTYNDIKVGKIYSSLRDVPLESAKAIASGIPLDDVKAEIEDQKTRRLLQDEDLHWYREGLKDSLEILDNIGKAESEEV